MLNLEYLIEEAKTNGLPILKKRAILREYLQVIILNRIYKHEFGRLIYFTGGTALRFFYNMPRFSEDLDFDASDLGFAEFQEILEYIRKELLKEGFSLEVSSEERGHLYIGELDFKDLIKTYGITDQRGLDLMIKIEVYNPRWKLKTRSDVLSLYGYNFSAILLDEGIMFSEKLCALLNRKRGRDIYDTLFLLKNKFSVNKDVLAVNHIQGSLRKIILEHLNKLSDKDRKYLAEQVKPFLFKEEDIDLILKASFYAENFFKNYK